MFYEQGASLIVITWKQTIVISTQGVVFVRVQRQLNSHPEFASYRIAIDRDYVICAYIYIIRLLQVTFNQCLFIFIKIYLYRVIYMHRSSVLNMSTCTTDGELIVMLACPISIQYLGRNKYMTGYLHRLMEVFQLRFYFKAKSVVFRTGKCNSFSDPKSYHFCDIVKSGIIIYVIYI